MMSKVRPTIFSQRHRMQILVALTAHIMTFSHGISLGWLSPSLLMLQSPETPLSFKVTADDVARIGSTFGIGALCGNILILINMKCFSRKLNMCCIALPHMLLWIFTYFAQSVECLYAARFCGGITSGIIYVIGPVFISEITEKEIRGTLSSMAMMFLSCGILVGYILPSYLNYHLIPCLVIFLAFIYFIAICCFPETPTGFLQCRKVQEAKAAFDFYRNIKSLNTSQNETGAYEMQLTAHNNEFEELKTVKLQVGKVDPITAQDFFNKSTIQKFGLAFVIIIQKQFSGSFAIINYMSHIFSESSSTLDPKTCTIIIGVVQIFGTLLACSLVDRFGRKTLMLLSVSGMATSMFCLGAFVQYTSDEVKVRYGWVPLIAVAFIVATASIGILSLTFTIIVEITPSKIRPEAQAIVMMFLSCMVFLTLRLYPYFLFHLGLSTTMYACAGSCVVTGTYLLIFLPETKGKSMVKD